MHGHTNQHTTLNRACFAGLVAVERAGWLAPSARQRATVKDSITMTLKRTAGGLSEGGLPNI